MSGGFTLIGGLAKAQNFGADTTVSRGTIVTASASANTKGSWTQFAASTATDIVGLAVMPLGGADNRSFGVDIGVGSAGNETVIISNLFVQRHVFSSNGMSGPLFYVPVCIPAGTRIAARCQASTGSAAVQVTMIGLDGSFTQGQPGGNVESFGFNAATTLGTPVTPSGSNNTKGSYAQLIASTSFDYFGIAFAFDDQNGTEGVQSLIDIAVGGAGSEVIILPNFPILTNTASLPPMPPATGLFPIQIPAGTRIAARIQCSTGTTAAIGISGYGVR